MIIVYISSMIQKSGVQLLSGLSQRNIGRLSRDCAGATAIVLAISLSGIAGFAGLGTEVAGWYNTKRAMQGAADTAASTAASALAAGATPTTLTNGATSVAAAHNFTDGSNGTTV